MTTRFAWASIACVSALAAFTASAAASDFEARCVAVSQNETLPEGYTEADVAAACACLAAKAEADPAVMADLEPGLDIPDFETRMSSVGPAGTAAIESCQG